MLNKIREYITKRAFLPKSSNTWSSFAINKTIEKVSSGEKDTCDYSSNEYTYYFFEEIGTGKYYVRDNKFNYGGVPRHLTLYTIEAVKNFFLVGMAMLLDIVAAAAMAIQLSYHLLIGDVSRAYDNGSQIVIRLINCIYKPLHLIYLISVPLLYITDSLHAGMVINKLETDAFLGVFYSNNRIKPIPFQVASYAPTDGKKGALTVAECKELVRKADESFSNQGMLTRTTCYKNISDNDLGKLNALEQELYMKKSGTNMQLQTRDHSSDSIGLTPVLTRLTETSSSNHKLG